jgi:hypothetical protein
MLGDGTLIRMASTVSADGRSPLFTKLYRSKGLLGGWAQFATDPASINGPLLWVKPANARDLLYPAGFSGVISMEGDLLPSTIPAE